MKTCIIRVTITETLYINGYTIPLDETLTVTFWGMAGDCYRCQWYGEIMEVPQCAVRVEWE